MPTPPIVIPGLKVIDVRREFQGGFHQPRTATTHLINHHAADHYKQTSGLDDVRAIARWHTGAPPNGNGWSGIGYQLVLAEETEGGEIVCYQVSDLETQRAHTWGLNDKMLGVCSAEDFTKIIPAPKWIEAQALTFAALLRIYPHAQVTGHKDVALPGHGTRCPGDRWAEWKPTLLNRIQALRSAPAPQPAPDPWLAWGTAYPLPVEQRLWGIPQLWSENARWLGEARSEPIYRIPDAQDGHNRFVLQLFQGGAIWGLDDHYQLIRYQKGVP